MKGGRKGEFFSFVAELMQFSPGVVPYFFSRWNLEIFEL
jgi:hypothetical protein